MKKTAVWLLLSCLMVAALVLTSCQPAAVEQEGQTVKGKVTEGEQPATVPGEKEEDEPGEVVIDPTVPQYGGTVTLAWNQEPSWFDDVAGHGTYAYTLMLTNEDLLVGDWGAASQGSNLDGFNYTHFPAPNATAGGIAESWEIVDDTTIVFNIRRGIHFHDKPPVNGREVTAADVVFSLKRLWETPGGYIYSSYPWDTHMESIDMPDEWTVVLHTKPARTGIVFNIAGFFMSIVPQEAIEEFGDLLDWRNSIGTGPWILTDYGTGMSASFVRNPDYWGTDPLHPGNQLPYLDEVKHLYIPDLSTRMAALRTAKVDHARAVPWEEGDDLTRSSPHLKWTKALQTTARSPAWRVDKPELPTYDIRVRQALMLAVDQSAIAEAYYGGNAALLAWPTMPTPDWADAYIPLEDLSESIQELFGYHPDKARELLAEAGYPDGFSVSIIAQAQDVDLLAIVKAYLADIGVDLTIDVKELGAMYSLLINKTYEEATIWGLHSYQPFRFIDVLKGDVSNMPMVDDPVIQQLHLDTLELYNDEAGRRALLKENIPYMLEKAWWLVLPMPETYTMWQPWIMGYGGELSVGYMNHQNWVNWVWLDRDLKEQLTGSR
jgi:peptide/nickel transport system substrate-binding protein